MPKFAKIFIISMAVLFSLLIIWSVILYFPISTNIDRTYSGYEISLTDPNYARPCDVSVVGKYKHYLIKPDFMNIHNSFEGNITLPEPYQSEIEDLELVDSYFSNNTNNIWLHYTNFFEWDKDETISHNPGFLYARKSFADLVIVMTETDTFIEYTGKIIVAPAESAEEARNILEEYRQNEKYHELDAVAEHLENQ